MAAQAGDPGAQGQPDAVVGVQVAVHAPDLGAEHPGQRGGVRANQGHLPAELAQEAAASLPIQPVPTTTTCSAWAAAVARVSASWRVRR